MQQVGEWCCTVCVLLLYLHKSLSESVAKLVAIPINNAISGRKSLLLNSSLFSSLQFLNIHPKSQRTLYSIPHVNWELTAASNQTAPNCAQLNQFSHPILSCKEIFIASCACQSHICETLKKPSPHQPNNSKHSSVIHFNPVPQQSLSDCEYVSRPAACRNSSKTKRFDSMFEGLCSSVSLMVMAQSVIDVLLVLERTGNKIKK